MESCRAGGRTGIPAISRRHVERRDRQGMPVRPRHKHAWAFRQSPYNCYILRWTQTRRKAEAFGSVV